MDGPQPWTMCRGDGGVAEVVSAPAGHDLHRTLRAGRGRAAGHDDTDPEHTIAFAWLMAGRNLTRDEWTQAFGDRPSRRTCS
jgi:hypothetical protein